MEYATIVSSIATAIFVGGVAWGATKSALNGTKLRVQQVHDELREHMRDEANADVETHERIARVETKVDILLDKIK